ncbi:SurA N-terminal domain-containing protein [Patescibacteria group bacterium]|nr:SurA N-terminal domain-containing protein [Patescibacteria group bacterium]
MKLPKITLPVALFILVIPLGILLGYFFSNIQSVVSGGPKNLLTPVYKMFYVAKVDGVGVSKREWEKLLKSRYGRSAAQDLIDVYMVNNELKKAGITVSEEEINAELATIEAQLAGQSLEEILSQQGRTLADFRKDVALQVGLKKLLSDKVVVTDQEVADYMEAYGESLPGATPEEQTENARKALIDQKLGEEINSWFMDLQSRVQVENYLE